MIHTKIDDWLWLQQNDVIKQMDIGFIEEAVLKLEVLDIYFPSGWDLFYQ